MTETSTYPSPQPAVLPRLERPRDAPFRGVCAAIARSTGTDPVLWRVLVVVTALFGGAGIALYLAGIIAIRREGEQSSLGERLLNGPDRRFSKREVLLLVLGAVVVVGLINDTDGIIVLTVAAVLGLMWWRGRNPQPAVPGTATDALTYAGPVAPPAPAWTPPPPRPRSPLGGVTASLAAVVAGVLLLIGATGDVSIPAEVVLASALGVVGVGLVVGSFLGRSFGLVLLAVLLGLGLAGTAAVRPALDAGVGDRSWHPTGPADYRLGVGDATLDLRDVTVRESGTVAIDARVDVGHLLVLVPEGVRISLDARAQLGDLDVLGVDTNGRHAHKHADLGPAGSPQLRLDLSVRTGQVEVRRG